MIKIERYSIAYLVVPRQCSGEHGFRHTSPKLSTNGRNFLSAYGVESNDFEKNKKGVKHSLYLQARVCILGNFPLLICPQHYNNFSNPPIFRNLFAFESNSHFDVTKKIRPSKDGLRSEEINKMIVDIDFTTPSLYGATSN